MNHSVCTTSWCDQGNRPHERHEFTVGTWPGESATGSDRGMFAQLIDAGANDQDARPILAIVDTADDSQTDIVLTWDQAHELAASIIGEAARFRRLNCPQ